MRTPITSRSSRRRARARGAVVVEYALALACVALPLLVGLVIAGADLAVSYATAHAQILRSIP